jgi:hypothetical protein
MAKLARTEAVHAPPKASSMVEALRGLGYSPATALADIIDNSISAGADRVELEFSWAGSLSTITISDNGHGMARIGLLAAMRLGERSPLDERKEHDLGRFGLGLKTASFSQCRRLTVASTRDGESSCLRWDLDRLASAPGDGWYLLEGPDPQSRVDFDSLRAKGANTVVAWEVMDRLVTPGFSEQDFLDLMDVVQGHLEMVFHRFLVSSRKKLVIKINGRALRPWDPLLVDHPATWNSPVTRLLSASGVVEVQCHVLPHKDRLDIATYERVAGPDGWTAQQGFYVYRNQRLLVAGSWLGLGRGRAWSKEEAHRLARVRIDLPNSADMDWKIDIRKSIARPPVTLREHLTRLAEDTRERARRVFAHRGTPPSRAGAEPVANVWRTERFNGGVRYRIDPEHPAVRAVLDQAGASQAEIRTMLRVLEETIPVQRIWLDTTEARETPRTGFSGEPSSEILEVARVLYRNLIEKKGMSPEMARRKLQLTEPFNLYPDVVSNLQ